MSKSNDKISAKNEEEKVFDNALLEKILIFLVFFAF